MLSLLAALVLAPPQTALSTRQHTLTDDRPKQWKASATYHSFGGGSALAALANRELRRAAAAQLADFAKGARELMADGMKPTSDWYFESVSSVQTARRDLISVYFASEVYTGGAHGSRDYKSHTFGLVRGRPKRLRLQDLFRRGVNGRKVVSNLVIARLRREERADWVRNGMTKALTAKQAEEFSVSRSGLMYVFPGGEMGAYASGNIDVRIPLSALRASLDRNGPLRPLLR